MMLVQLGSVRSKALVVMLSFFFCAAIFASAGPASYTHRHAHQRIRRASVVKRSGADCPEGKNSVSAYVQDQIKKLSSTSAHQGGKEEVKDAIVPNGAGTEHVQVRAKSDASGRSRSWSWHWSSHSSSSSTSSSSSSDTSNVSNTRFFNDDRKHAKSLPTHDYDGQEESKHSEVLATPQPVIRHTETEYSHSQHQSSSKEEDTATTKDETGKETRKTTKKEWSSSSSTSSYSHFSNVFRYVIGGNTEPSDNIAPFQDGQVHWTRSPIAAANLAVSPALGLPITRPARANTCNRRFPFTGRRYTAEDEDHRFTKPFSKEALDPVSKVALDLHNAERARYGLRPLQWNTELANMASCWADLKAYGHSEDHFCASGENIAMGLGSPCYADPMQGMKNAIYSFLDEDRNFAESRQMDSSTGHWLQIVWKDTQFVGCAVSQRKNFMEEYSSNDEAFMYVVCEYYPPGNIQGQIEDLIPAFAHPTHQLRSSCSANERHT